MTEPKFIEYIWLDGRGTLRSKTRVVESNIMFPCAFLITDSPLSFNLNWNYDGSSCYQAQGDDSEIILIAFSLVIIILGVQKTITCLCVTLIDRMEQFEKQHLPYELFRTSRSL